ncbi:TIM-barrel domain-containing protein [Marinicrinis sediminis]|uniref:TIM-barrel domain-containing protein n=1 Tax=Marinicrinis sediminis TaxID=1652465 RepID=A0ABW5R7T5_9BACL
MWGEINQLTTRDAAFWAVYQIRRGAAGEVKAFLTTEQAEYVQTQPSALDTSYWLWVLGEYMKASGDKELLEEMSTWTQSAIQRVLSAWQQPEAHWLGVREPAIYLSHFAIHYGALLSMQPYVMTEEIQQGLKAIRECVFARFIKEGRVVSKLGSTDIYGDIVLAAVPFGMLGIEDRILIEALMVVQEELVHKGVRFAHDDTYFGGCEHTALSGLLAWYYIEKGELSKGKRLLAQLDQLADEQGRLPEIDPATTREPLYVDPHLNQASGQLKPGHLASILKAMAQLVLEERAAEQAASSESAVKILHEPTGKDDPYLTFPYERYPRQPLASDLVRIRMQTEPVSASQQVLVEYKVNEQEGPAISMTLEATPDGEQYWEAFLGRFAWGDQVQYRFRVEDDGEQVTSKWYACEISKWLPLEDVTAIYRDGDAAKIHFAPLPAPFGNTASSQSDNAGSPVLTCHTGTGTDASVRMQIAFDEPAPGQQTAHMPEEATGLSWMIGEYAVRIERAASGWTYQIERQGQPVVSSYTEMNGSFLEVLTDGRGHMSKLRVRLHLQSDERVFGMGERFSRIEYRGLELDNYVYNEYRSQGLKTYIPNPFYLSSAGYGLYVDTMHYTKFRFGSRIGDLLEVEVNLAQGNQRPIADMNLFLGQPLQIMEQYANVSGKPVLPPKWAFGPWMSSNNWDSQQEVEKQVALTNQYQIPSTVLVLEQWSDEATFYIFNDAQYEVKDGNEALTYEDFTFPEWGRWPNPKQMVDDLHANGLKVLLWQIPIQKYMYGIAHGQRDADEQAMLDNGYYVRMADGQPYRIPYNWFKDCLVIDFSHPQAKEWWFRKRRYLTEEIGFDGFKTDGGECIFGDDLMFADGSTGAELRNRYPLDYIGSYYEFVQEQTGGDGITFSRAGYSGAQKFPMHWAGDERSTYEAFRASIRAGLSCSMSGIPYWGWDLGGFHGDIPTAELFVRSTQMAAFCPVMQYHAETKGEFNQDRTPWNIAERTGKPEVIGLYKQYADMRMNILPYIYDQAIKSSRTGLPMMRAMFVSFPDDPRGMMLEDQYMFGDHLLVAPVVEEGQFTRSVYFPAGSWISLLGEHEVRDGKAWQTVTADLDEIPVYMRENSMLALNLDDSLQLASHVGNRVDQYEQLCFMLYITDHLQETFEDDLGKQAAFTATRHEGHVDLTCRLAVDHPVTLIFRGLDKVETIFIDGERARMVHGSEDLAVGCWMRQHHNWIVRLDRAAASLQIRLKS